VDFIPCICRTPSAEKYVTLVGRSAIDADLSARALEELLGRTHKGAATNHFSAKQAHSSHRGTKKRGGGLRKKVYVLLSR